MNTTLEIFKCTTKTELSLIYADEGVQAGFPSPAQDFLEHALDFNRDMVKNPDATFYARVKGESMIDEGITTGDILVIDRSLTAKYGNLTVCAIDGEFTLKRLKLENEKISLIPANTYFSPIEITEDMEFILWGVVIFVIKKTY